jgi:hypothetical protein
MQLGDEGEWWSAQKSSAPEMADDREKIVAIGNPRALGGVSTSRALAADKLFAARPHNLLEGASLRASPQA